MGEEKPQLGNIAGPFISAGVGMSNASWETCHVSINLFLYY